MGNGTPERNKGMAPKSEHGLGHSVSLHVLEKIKKLECQVEAGEKPFEVLTQKQVIRAALYKENSGYSV